MKKNISIVKLMVIGTVASIMLVSAIAVTWGHYYSLPGFEWEQYGNVEAMEKRAEKKICGFEKVLEEEEARDIPTGCPRESWELHDEVTDLYSRIATIKKAQAFMKAHPKDKEPHLVRAWYAFWF